ncbi:MAG TPA: DinB family protein [Vicinamibacterales bacterium]|nr:DinB family protein [Vicinamibacterales bacterium]
MSRDRYQEELWLLLHAVHHRGQLTLLCRLAGGIPPGLFGRTREDSTARQTVAAIRSS